MAIIITVLIMLIPYIMRFAPGKWLLAHKKLYTIFSWIAVLMNVPSIVTLSDAAFAEGVNVQYLFALLVIATNASYVWLSRKMYNTEYDKLGPYSVGFGCAVSLLFI